MKKVDKEMLGKVLEVRFYDHAVGSINTKEIVCTAWGKLAKNTSKSITLQTWVCEDDEDQANTEATLILKKVIISVKVLG